jgi:hypothetical protein
MDDDLAHPRPDFVTFDFHAYPRGSYRVAANPAATMGLPEAAGFELQQIKVPPVTHY